MTSYDYDLFVIGGGSGGVRAGRLAGSMGKRVGLAEEFRMGGTCVIRGCVPKKLYVYASQFPEHFSDAAGYGWTVGERSFDWSRLVANKEAEITRLEGLYAKGLNSAKTEIFASRAVLKDAHTIELTALGKTVTAETILIATGGRPFMDESMPGHELCVNSDQVFDLKSLPKSIVIQGGGYIAVEFAGIFNGLGVETTIVYRGKQLLSRFDSDLFTLLNDAMIEKGIRIVTEAKITAVHEAEGEHSLSVSLSNGDVLAADQVLQAIGRVPNTKGLGLEAAGVAMAGDGSVVVDAYSHTNVENIWAVGDVTNRVQLTPVAIHESMCFLETAFKGNAMRPDHELIPTAVFSQPEIGTVGLSEEDAAKQYTNVEVYRAHFRPMRNTLAGRSDKMLTKLVVDGDSRKVVGAHVLGPDAGEMAQLLGIALKASATKDDFDRTMALHPSAAEEFVTMYSPSYRLVNGVRES
ncbi:glutathione-disulfide reductase [Pseudochrobactrum sp. MP213Fo]|uniref:glutathione-disulfide reductase n=1 Tax=Pseudochrobactrum sp. MP213Fo TaxID=3022250 RepID=UPI003BA2F60B